jgi:hypothetical protein
MLHKEEDPIILLSLQDKEILDRLPTVKRGFLPQDFTKKIDISQWLSWWLQQGMSDQERYESVLENCLKDNRYHTGLICVIGHRIQDLFLSNQPSLSPGRSFPSFHSENPPEISVPDYFYKLVRGSGSDLSTAVLSAFMIQKFQSVHPDFAINSFQIHKVVLGAVIASHKYLEEDQPKSNRAFATMTKLDLKMVSQIEAEFLFAVGFDIEETNFFGVLGQLFQNDFNLIITNKKKRKSDYLEGLGFEDCFC